MIYLVNKFSIKYVFEIKRTEQYEQNGKWYTNQFCIPVSVNGRNVIIIIYYIIVGNG